MSETISIIICTRDRAESLKKTLSALVRLQVPQVPCATEIIVVDNASRDDTAAVVRTIAGDHPLPLRLISEARPGKSAALNSAISAAHGTILAFTDDDALPQSNWLMELARAFDIWQADWVFGRVIPAWQSGPPPWFGPELNGMFSLLDFGREPFLVTDRRHMFFGVNCAVRRPAIEALGPYRMDLGPTNALGGGGEDMEMFSRALSAGQRIVYAPSATVAHVIPIARTTRSFHRRRIFDGRRSAYRIIKSDGTPGPRLLDIPRYRYRRALKDAAVYFRARFGREAAPAFHSELRLIGFAGLIQQALVTRVGMDAGSNPLSPSTRLGR